MAVLQKPHRCEPEAYPIPIRHVGALQRVRRIFFHSRISRDAADQAPLATTTKRETRRPKMLEHMQFRNIAR